MAILRKLGIGFGILVFINFFMGMILENMEIELEFFGIDLSGFLSSIVETIFIMIAFLVGKSSSGIGGT